MNDRWNQELSRFGAHFDEGRVAHYGKPDAERAAAGSGTVLCDLSHEGLMAISGEDAVAFLHGQFTNDVLALTDGVAQWNGWCSPKGRLLATFLLWQSKQGFLLQLPRALQPAIQKRLQMFVLRSRVTLEDASARWVRFGVAGPAAATIVRGAMGALPDGLLQTVHTDAGRVIRLSAQRFEIVAGINHALRLWAACAENAVPAGATAWDLAMIRDGLISIRPETQDQFVPQMANFELAGGVSFKKGCYPGQEIVARTQYRGILKRRMARVHGVGPGLPRPGDSVYAAEFGDQAAGMIANVAPAPEGGFEALVVAQLDSIRADSLRLENVNGPPLQVLPLPYPIAEDG
jgi:hypothetical protein